LDRVRGKGGEGFAAVILEKKVGIKFVKKIMIREDESALVPGWEKRERRH